MQKSIIAAVTLFIAYNFSDFCLWHMTRYSDGELIAQRILGIRGRIDSVPPIKDIDDARKFFQSNSECCSVYRFGDDFIEHGILRRLTGWPVIEVYIRVPTNQPQNALRHYEARYGVNRCGEVSAIRATTVASYPPAREEHAEC